MIVLFFVYNWNKTSSFIDGNKVIFFKKSHIFNQDVRGCLAELKLSEKKAIFMPLNEAVLIFKDKNKYFLLDFTITLFQEITFRYTLAFAIYLSSKNMSTHESVYLLKCKKNLKMLFNASITSSKFYAF